VIGQIARETGSGRRNRPKLSQARPARYDKLEARIIRRSDGLSEPDTETLYERDFYAWTRDQAERLRELRGANRLDAAQIAEEIEDLGKRDRRALRAQLTRALQHLLKAAVAPDGDLEFKWIREVRGFLRSARDIAEDSPSLLQTLDAERIWQRARAEADQDLRDFDDPTLPPEIGDCPVALSELVSAEADAWDLLERVRGALDR
jgi:hypothetical protein